MTDQVGKNTHAAAELRDYVERIERLDEQKKAIGDDRKAVMAEAVARGFDGPAISRAIRRRKAKPHDVQKADAMDATYQHALGMDAEPPLYRQIEALAKDSVAGEKLLQAWLLMVPLKGDCIVTIDGKKIRMWRDKDGKPHFEDYTPPEPSGVSRNVPEPRAKKEVPDCSPDEADALGEAAAKNNEPVINNPFPYKDDRRGRWDEGWRRGAGNDGMGG